MGAAARTWHPKDVLPCSELDNLFYFFLKVGVLLLDRILHRYINAFYHPTIIFFCGQQLGRAPAAHVDGPRHWPLATRPSKVANSTHSSFTYKELQQRRLRAMKSHHTTTLPALLARCLVKSVYSNSVTVSPHRPTVCIFFNALV